jgi:hypothetical protein
LKTRSVLTHHLTDTPNVSATSEDLLSIEEDFSPTLFLFKLFLMENRPETLEEFEQRKSEYIHQKAALASKLRALIDKQDEVLLEIAKLRRPLQGPAEDFCYVDRYQQEHIRRILNGEAEEEERRDCIYRDFGEEVCHCADSYCLGHENRIEVKQGARRTESIYHSNLQDGIETVQNEQRYVLNNLDNPKYLTETEKEGGYLDRRDSW